MRVPKYLITLTAGLVLYASLFGVLVGWETPVGTLRPLDVALVCWSFLSLFWVAPFVWTKRLAMLLAVTTLTWFMAGTLWLSSAWLAGLAYVLRWVVGLWAAWTLSYWLREQNEVTHTWVDIWGILFTGLGVGQYLFLPDARILLWSGWDDHLFRAFGTLLDPLFFGLAASLLAWRGFRRVDTRTGRILVIVALLAVVLSFSRLALVATLGWLLLESWPLARWRKTIPVFLLCGALVLLVPKDGGGEGQKLLRTSSLQARTSAIQQDVTAQRSPVWGGGWYLRAPNPLAFAPENAKQADVLWLQLYLSGGAVGVSLALVTLWLWNGRSRLVWWHVLGGLASVASFSPWILVASAVLSEPKNK